MKGKDNFKQVQIKFNRVMRTTIDPAIQNFKATDPSLDSIKKYGLHSHYTNKNNPKSAKILRV